MTQLVVDFFVPRDGVSNLLAKDFAVAFGVGQAEENSVRRTGFGRRNECRVH
jgi:hypothetical protein